MAAAAIAERESDDRGNSLRKFQTILSIEVKKKWNFVANQSDENACD